MLAGLAALTLGCGSPTPSTSVPGSAEAGEAREVEVGRHPVRFEVPPGWQHYDYGNAHRIERGLSQISLTDLGPVTREAIRREIESSRRHFGLGRNQDARDMLLGLELREAVPDERTWNQMKKPWQVLRRLGTKNDPDPLEIEDSYLILLAQVDSLPSRDLEQIALAALPRVGHDPMRGIAEQRPQLIDRRDGLRIESWDRLSHGMRQSYLFVVNDGRLLVVRMELGSYPEMTEAFEALVSSLELPLPQPSGS